MTGDRAIKRVDLMRMLGSESPADDEQSIVEVLGGLDVDELISKAIPTRELQTIYERRRARMPDAHPLAQPVDRLLAALKNYRGAEVYAVTLEASGRIAVVWLSESSEAVISILVGDDDR